MKLNLIERLITNSPVRSFTQRHIEAPMLKNMASQREYPVSLEIGCGRGAGAQVIAEKFGAKKVIATDMDPEQIKRARKNLKPALMDKIEFKVADAMALNEPDGKFDAVFSFGVIHHVEDWKKSVNEIARVLKQGGDLFFEELLKPFLSSRLIKTLTVHPEGGMFNANEFIEELKGNGIDIIKMRRIDNIVIFGVGRKR